MYGSLICLTIASSLISLYYATMSLKAKDSHPTAQYAFVRSISVVILIGLALALDNRALFLGSALLMAFIQLGDSVVGLRLSDKLKTYGPLSVAIASFILLALNYKIALHPAITVRQT